MGEKVWMQENVRETGRWVGGMKEGGDGVSMWYQVKNKWLKMYPSTTIQSGPVCVEMHVMQFSAKRGHVCASELLVLEDNNIPW